MSRSASNQCPDYAPCFSSPNPPSSHSSATSTSKASRHQGKNERGGHGGQSIDRLITAGWGVPLLKTRRPRHISSHHVIAPRATLELVRKKKLGTSGLRLQLSDRNVETKKWVLLHTHKYFIYHALYTTTRVTFLAKVALSSRKENFNTHAQGHAIFGFTPFEISRTHVYIRNCRFIRWPKK
jgi:hypothetical protein